MFRLQANSVEVEAPASSANLGPGFDVFAIALAKPQDRLTLSVAKAPYLKVEIKFKGRRTVPLNPETNAAGAVALRMAQDLRLRSTMSIVLEKRVPVGIGLGSSAASSSAAAFAMNECFELGLGIPELIRYAAHGEFVASGTEHYDNVAASLMGGFVIVCSGSRGPFTRLEPPKSLAVCLATPRVRTPERKTEYARSILPKKVELEKMVKNVSAASTIVAGFAAKDVGLIGRGMRDKVVEPARSRMIPGYGLVRKKALEAGAVGACISGAGPTMLALVDSSKVNPTKVLRVMIDSFKEAGASAQGFVTTIGGGVRLIHEG